MADKTTIQLFSLIWSNWNVRTGNAIPQVLDKLQTFGQRQLEQQLMSRRSLHLISDYHGCGLIE